MRLETQRIESAVKEAAESIRKTPAVRRRKNVSYAAVVKVGYEEIQKLRNDGYSYDVICEVLSEKGVLAVDASPKNLRTAFMREAKRRFSRTQEESSTNIANIGSMKKVMQDGLAAINPNGAAPKKKAEAGKTETMEERIKRMTSNTVHIGTGTIIKHADGSFDY